MNPLSLTEKNHHTKASLFLDLAQEFVYAEQGSEPLILQHSIPSSETTVRCKSQYLVYSTGL